MDMGMQHPPSTLISLHLDPEKFEKISAEFFMKQSQRLREKPSMYISGAVEPKYILQIRSYNDKAHVRTV